MFEFLKKIKSWFVDDNEALQPPVAPYKIEAPVSLQAVETAPITKVAVKLRQPGAPKSAGQKKPAQGKKPQGAKPAAGNKPAGQKKPAQPKPQGGQKPAGNKPRGRRPKAKPAAPQQ